MRCTERNERKTQRIARGGHKNIYAVQSQLFARERSRMKTEKKKHKYQSPHANSKKKNIKRKTNVPKSQ